MFREAVKRLDHVVEHVGGVERAANLVDYYAEVGYNLLVPSYARHG